MNGRVPLARAGDASGAGPWRPGGVDDPGVRGAERSHLEEIEEVDSLDGLLGWRRLARERQLRVVPARFLQGGREVGPLRAALSGSGDRINAALDVAVGELERMEFGGVAPECEEVETFFHGFTPFIFSAMT